MAKKADDKPKEPEGNPAEEMRQHYRETGTYRAEDIRRVLGDPVEGIGGPPLRVSGLACIAEETSRNRS